MCLSCSMYLIPVTILHMLQLLCATKRRNILTLVLFEKLFLNETKKHTPPSPSFKLNGRSLMYLIPVTILHMLHLLLLHLSRRKIVSLMNVTFRRMPGMTMFLLIFIFAILSFSFYLV
jgi:hypothetical protein